MTTLDTLKIGDEAEIVKINVSGELRKRLLSMGISKGVKIIVNRLAPLGDPMEIKLNGFYLSLRKSEAQGIEILKL